MSIKNSWKKVGGDFAQFGRDMKDGRIEGRTLKRIGVDFGKSMVLSVTKGAEKAADWAETEEPAPPAENPVEQAEAPAENPVEQADTPAEEEKPEQP